MSLRLPLVRRAVALSAGALVALGGVATASAHVVQQFGPYSIAIGWLHEPTYVGVENAVQVVVKDAQDKPVDGLPDGALKVQVSSGSQTTDAMTLQPSFDPDTGLGTPGEYDASLIPTAPGVYTFHLTGTIKRTRVDQSFTSSDKTFDDVTANTDAEFPLKVPSITSIATRLDRTGSRVVAAQAAADDAKRAADRALLIGIVALALGVVLGGSGVALAMRRRAA
jgi:hypothetical protein